VGFVALAGTAIGAVLGNGLGSLISGLLFEVTPDDPVTFCAALVVIGLTTLAATIVPVSRAVRVSPATTLKAE
jgi:ABC-type antimicrobial peptide transport system permease subunit